MKNGQSEDRPRVSVVVACYRHEAFIERCLKSIAAQSYPNIELIVVDDCSPDATFERVQDFLKKNEGRFGRVCLKRNATNRGAHFAFNRGMSLAQGTFIALMNSDDCFAPNRLEKLVTALQASGAQWAFSSVMTTDENDRPYVDEPVCHHIHWHPWIYAETLPSLSWGFLAFQLTASTGNLVIARDFARRIGGFADLKYCHDWDYMLRATFFAEPTFVREDLYYYRVHGANSFKSLGSVATQETQYCLRGHFRRVMTARPINPLAAAPQNWPTLFRSLVDVLGVGAHYESLYEPYRPHHRTIDHAALSFSTPRGGS